MGEFCCCNIYTRKICTLAQELPTHREMNNYIIWRCWLSFIELALYENSSELPLPGAQQRKLAKGSPTRLGQIQISETSWHLQRNL